MSQLRWLITGCSPGLGEALVMKALARGDKVVATARGDSARLSALKDAGAETISLDVTSLPEHIVSVVEQILKDGSIDVLVNNAGYAEVGLAEELRYAWSLHRAKAITCWHQHSYKQYSDAFETSFFGTVKITQAVLPHFRAK